MTSLAAAFLVIFPQLDLPGTQPGELGFNLRTPSNCSTCHGGYADYAAYDSWAGSMMANAARDPIYLAALTVANQDIPGSGELCIKCHSPRGWLAGRGIPTDQSALVENDYESVECDFCHRMTPGPGDERFIGNGHFYVADDYISRGSLNDAAATHQVEYSEYISESEFCGACHDVSNPLQNDFAVERTYSEWKNSAFADENQSCQSCHMVVVDNAYNTNNANTPLRSVPRHDLVGGNVWVPLMMAGMYPGLGREQAFQYTSDRARELLQESAALTVEVDNGRGVNELGMPILSAGKNNRIAVRVENLTGHKLPTGYPEGRRAWLEVKLIDSQGVALYSSGGYDLDTATRSEDPDLHTYEAKLASGGVEGFHFVTTDEVLQDNRIPPRGFRPTPATQPVGREYQALEDGSLAHWDDVVYNIDIPDAALLGSGTLIVNLWYQTTSREYIEFLRDENVTDNRGQELYDLWLQYDRAPPVAMASVTLDIELTEAPACGCQVQQPGAGPWPMTGPAMLGLLGLLAIRLRRRRQV